MEQVYEEKKIDYLFQNLPAGLVAIATLLSVLYYLFYTDDMALSAHLWYGAGFLIILLRGITFWHYKKIQKGASFQRLLKEKNLFCILATLTALQLGSGAVFILPESLTNQIVLIFFIGGLATGATVTLATYKKLYNIYLVSAMLPYATVLFLGENEAVYALAFSILLYIAFLWITAIRITENVNTNIMLTHNNAELIQQLQAEVESSKIANEAKSKFLSVMSHELRTPLNAVIGFSQVILRMRDLDPKTFSFVEKINISGQNLLTLVNSILDFSKIDKGEMEYHPENIDFEDLIEEINILIEPQLREKSIAYTTFSAEGLIIFGDKQLLKQAFVNVLSNAIKFTPEGGAVEFSYSFTNSKHRFCIKDSGAGIETEDLKILFEPFKQAQNIQHNLVQGTGLGLAITANIIQKLHKGDIWVESEVGKGTSFYIEL